MHIISHDICIICNFFFLIFTRVCAFGIAATATDYQPIMPSWVSADTAIRFRIQETSFPPTAKKMSSLRESVNFTQKISGNFFYFVYRTEVTGLNKNSASRACLAARRDGVHCMVRTPSAMKLTFKRVKAWSIWKQNPKLRKEVGIRVR